MMVVAQQSPPEVFGRPQTRLPDFLSVGSIVDECYRIDSLLGTGGMCEVYKAQHLHLMKPVALKMLRPTFLADPSCIERFRREAMAMAKLKHPNIVEMYGFGYFESRFQSRPYMALELVEGCTLSDFASQQNGERLCRELAMPIFLKICDALEHAHSKGLVHRDLKPSNIMIGLDGQTVKVIDFGIAKIISEDSDAMQKLTLTGGAIGSVIYMSPEQCTEREIDRRTDIYSMGCLMYEVLTGEPPLRGDSAYATMHKHVFEVPEMKPDLDNDIGGVIMCALAKDPDRRYQSALELRRALAEPRCTAKPRRQFERPAITSFAGATNLLFRLSRLVMSQ